MFIPEKKIDEYDYIQSILDMAEKRIERQKQKSVFQNMQRAGFNIVNCPFCGDIVLLEEPVIGDIECPHCSKKASQENFPDFYY